MRALDYDFGYLGKSISYLVNDDNKSGYNVMKELNNFFKDDMSCIGVKFTENTDNEFFGIYIKSTDVDPKSIMGIEGELKNPNKYLIEIDSKLSYILSPMELVSIIIYEIKNIVSKTALEKFRDAFTFYIGMNDYMANIENIVHYDKLFNMVYDESVATLYSIFRRPTDEVCVGDDFMSGCGLYEYFNSAVDKIKSLKDSVFSTELSDKLLTMQWYVSIINSINTDTRYISTILREGFESTGSRLLRTNILNAIKELEPMTDHVERYFNTLTESRSLVNSIKQNGIRSIEQDVYEYTMRIKNIEDENDALLLMRQINNRISILEDYVATEELEDRERDKIYKLMDKYYTLRESLTKKTVYKQKMYGLFADYNALQKMYMNGQLQTIY